jgi:hypothetical protein
MSHAGSSVFLTVRKRMHFTRLGRRQDISLGEWGDCRGEPEHLLQTYMSSAFLLVALEYWGRKFFFEILPNFDIFLLFPYVFNFPKIRG